MTTYTLDTHETVRQFVAAGIPDKQAEVIVAALSRSDSELATKADLKQEVAAVRADLDALRSDVKIEISAAINKMLLAQIAVAGLLFAALKLF